MRIKALDQVSLPRSNKQITRWKLGVAFAIGVLASCPAMHGDAINLGLLTASTTASATVSVPNSYCNNAVRTSATCSGSYYVTAGQGNIFELADGSASARASYGILGAAASAAASAYDAVGDTEVSGSAQSSASFSDYAYVTSTSERAGVLAYPFILNGFVGTAVNQSNPANPVSGGGGYAYVTFPNNQSVEDTNPPGVAPIQDVFLLPFDLSNYDGSTGLWYDLVPFSATLYAHTSCTAEGEQSASPRAGTCDAAALFYDTFAIQGIIPEDVDGNVLSGIKIATASGTTYNDLQVAETPEPSTLMLSGTGLALGGFISLQRKKIGNALLSM